MKSKIIRNIIIIIIILAAAFLSQQVYFGQTYFGQTGQNFFSQFLSQGTKAVRDCWAKSSNWVKDNLYPKISGEVQKRGEIIKKEINQEKQKISETIGEKIKNYFSGIIDNIFNPGKK